MEKNKYSAKYWATEISSRENDYKTFTDQAEESIKVYNAKHKFEDIQRRLNCWWYCVNTLLPAYYSSTPKVEIKLRKGMGAPQYSAASVILERATQYELSMGFDFDNVGFLSAQQFLLTGLNVLWVRYEADIEEFETSLQLIRTPDGQLVDMEGVPFDAIAKEGMEVEVAENERGALAVIGGKRKTGEQAIIEVVNYQDFLTSNARTEEEIEWKAKRAYLSEEKAEKLFGGDVAKELNYNMTPERKGAALANEHTPYEKKAELWEIHCRETGKVYWLQKGDKNILESGDPPLKFKDFYPCEVMAGSIDPDSVIPVSDYTHVKDLILEAERLTTRIHAVTQAIRTNRLYDASLGEEVEGLITGDLKMIPVRNWPSYRSRGGLSAMVESLDIEVYIRSLEILSVKRQESLQQLYDSLKVSDLLRGTSQEYKTATANRLENQWSTLGLVVRQNLFAKHLGKAIEKLATVVAQHYDEERIFESADAEQILATYGAQDPQSQMMLKQQIMEIFRNDTDRCYKLEIASDSMVALDERQEREDARDLLQSTGTFFQQMQAVLEKYPELISFSLELMKFVTRKYKGGKELEPIFMQALQTVVQVVQQQRQQEQNKPDPKEQDAQVKLQIAQMKAQTDAQDNAIKVQEMQQKAAIENEKLQLEAARVALEMKEKFMEEKRLALEQAMGGKQ